MVKNLPASAGDAGSVPGSGRSLEKEMATHFSILALEIPWTEKPGGRQSMGLQESHFSILALEIPWTEKPGGRQSMGLQESDTT